MKDRYRFTFGRSFNGPSYWCPPYAGIHKMTTDTDSWWHTNNVAGEVGTLGGSSWDVPLQDEEITPKGISPCYARKTKISYQTYNIDDRFQVIQLPWPKGARNSTEAYRRILCWLKCVSTSVCLNPEDIDENDPILEELANMPEIFEMTDAGSDPTRHRWLNGIRVFNNADGTFNWEETDCAKKCLGYEAKAEWVTYDSLCVQTNNDSRGGCQALPNDVCGLQADEWNANKPKYGDIANRPGFGDATLYKCVSYNYPQCPLRLDKKQVLDHFHADLIYSDADDATLEDVIKSRLEEGYGTGGQGPIPPIFVGFANCNPDGDDVGSSVWIAKMSDCSGRETVYRGINNVAGTGGAGGGDC